MAGSVGTDWMNASDTAQLSHSSHVAQCSQLALSELEPMVAEIMFR
jgi:hypothetical protein